MYLSQIHPRIPAVAFAPSRARGIVLLAAPVGWSSSIAVVRVFLAVLSAAMLIVAFAAWRSLIGSAATFASVLFAGSWVALFYGSEVMPNLWEALFALLAVALLARSIERSDVRLLASGAAALGTAALFRPIDAGLVTACLFVYVVIGRAPVRVLLGAVSGFAVGVLPWLIEMSIRFGDPVEAVRRAASVGHVRTGHPGFAFVQQLALTDGPTLGPERHPAVPPIGVVWWTGVAALAVGGLIARRRTDRCGVLVLTAAIGGAAFLLYLAFVAGLAPRFLLPAYAFLSIPAGAGLAATARRPALRMFALVGVGAWLAVQLVTGHAIGSGAVRDRGQFQTVGRVLARVASGRRCSFASAAGFPEIQLASGCPGRQLGTRPQSVRFVVTRSSLGRGWRTAATVRGTRWRIDERAAG